MCNPGDTCYEAAKRFVKTAVVIDDEADYLRDETIPLPATFISPLNGLTDVAASISGEPGGTIIADDSDQSPFDVTPVVEGFAGLKISCSVQRPVIDSDQKKEQVKEWALNCAEHSDITIIDWRLLKSGKRLFGHPLDRFRGCA